MTITITLDIRSEVQAELSRQAAAHGSALEAYAASLLEDAVHPTGTSHPDRGQLETTGTAPTAVIDACERLRTFGKSQGLSLGGLTIRELRHEARP